MKNIVIVAAKRTAVGAFNGTLSTTPASTLGATVIKALLNECHLNPDQVDEVIMGQAIEAGAGQNPARQALILAGLADSIPGFTVNKVCGSGLKSLQLATQALLCGDAQIIIAGGQENMSLGPHVLAGSRKGKKMGDWVLEDSSVKDGLIDFFHHYHMGVTAEKIAEQFHITREEQDAFAFASQQKCAAAMANHLFEAEITPITISLPKKEPIIFKTDEFPKPDTKLEVLAKLKPAFKTVGGTVTAGNASGLNDGAAAVVLMTEEKASSLGLKPLARIAAYASAGVDPTIMGTGPVPATQKCLAKAGWKVSDLDLIEANEAFAAQAIYVNRILGWDTNKVNINGGAIALGHPIGASGTRILVTLLYSMLRNHVHKGLATLCIGGGMGTALAIEI